MLNLPEYPAPPRPGQKAKATDPSFFQKAEEFISRYGVLRPGLLAFFDNHSSSEDEIYSPARRIAYVAHEFREMWNLQLQLTRDPQAAKDRKFGAILDVLLEPFHEVSELRVPALRANFLTGTFEPIPRDPLDAVALEFMHSRKAIHRCERCNKFFIKTFPRDRYCSTACGTEARTEAQREWMRNFRAEQKKKSKGRKERGQNERGRNQKTGP